jgi:hypothetical protein
MEKIATLAPGRLNKLLVHGLNGHHPLFNADEIRVAFEAPDSPVSIEDANEVGAALLSMCRESVPVARGAVDTMTPRARISLIRLYFRLLDRAHEERASPLSH